MKLLQLSRWFNIMITLEDIVCSAIYWLCICCIRGRGYSGQTSLPLIRESMAWLLSPAMLIAGVRVNCPCPKTVSEAITMWVYGWMVTAPMWHLTSLSLLSVCECLYKQFWQTKYSLVGYIPWEMLICHAPEQWHARNMGGGVGGHFSGAFWHFWPKTLEYTWAIYGENANIMLACIRHLIW